MEELLISADSHVIEPHDLWEQALSGEFGDAAPKFKKMKLGEDFQHRPGGGDPQARISEMEQDGVSAEVLYPTFGLSLFNLEDARLQQACFRVYNDWMIDYCRVAPDRLLGIACIPTLDIDAAVAEVERCRDAGLRGAEIWEVPPPDLPFHSDHYTPLWEALVANDMPLSMHILTGYIPKPRRFDVEGYRQAVGLKTGYAIDAVFEFIFHGIFERYPDLKLVMVEHEVGFWPWVIQQWDYYHNRFKESNPLPLQMKPSEYCSRQLYTTFFNDHVGTQTLSVWEGNNCMWSNDFPHENSTWPNSHKIIERDLAHLSPEARRRVMSGTVQDLYGLTTVSR